MSKRVARIRNAHPIRISVHGVLSGPKKNSFSRVRIALKLIKDMFRFWAEICSGRSCFIARQNIAVTQVNSSVNHLGRIDLVQPDQIFKIMTQCRPVGVQVELSLSFVMEQHRLPFARAFFYEIAQKDHAAIAQLHFKFDGKVEGDHVSKKGPLLAKKKL